MGDPALSRPQNSGTCWRHLGGAGSLLLHSPSVCLGPFLLCGAVVGSRETERALSPVGWCHHGPCCVTLTGGPSTSLCGRRLCRLWGDRRLRKAWLQWHMCWMNERQGGRWTNGAQMGGKGQGHVEEGPECPGSPQPRGLRPHQLTALPALDPQVVAMQGTPAGTVPGAGEERGEGLRTEVGI